MYCRKNLHDETLLMPQRSVFILRVELSEHCIPVLLRNSDFVFCVCGCVSLALRRELGLMRICC
jgi:hypothetical protein